MSWNAKVRCIDDKGGEHTKGGIYNVKNGKIRDDKGMLSTFTYRNISDLNKGFMSQFELVEDEKTCENCGNKSLSDKTETCNKCVTGKLPCGKMSSPSHWTPRHTDINVGNMAKSIDNKQIYWNNICKMQQRQTEKGIKRYGQVLENNIQMDMKTRLEYLQEELIDGLMYIEHIKSLLGIGGVENEIHS